MAAGDVDLTTVGQIAGAVSGAVTPVVVVWLLVKGTLVRGSELEKAQAQRDALQDTMTHEVIPALTRATDALQEAQAEARQRRRS